MFMARNARIVAEDDGRIRNMARSREVAIDDLYHVEGKAELVNGELVLMSAAGKRHGRVALRIAASLLAHENRTGRGHALPDNVGFIVDLPHRWSFSPDAAYSSQPDTDGFADGAPVFAVEVRSQDDYGPAAERAMAEKRADYFAADTQVVWDVDAIGEQSVRVYRATASAAPTVYRRGEIAEAEPALPGWSMLVDDLFPD
jgi:Uma2 family endonuclease